MGRQIRITQRPRIERANRRAEEATHPASDGTAHCSNHDAETFIDETDNGRAALVRRYFHHDIADPHLYDLVINLEHTSRDAALDLILGDYLMRFEPAKCGCAFRIEEDRSSQRL